VCKKQKGRKVSEECFQRTPLAFATARTAVFYPSDPEKGVVEIEAVTTSKGTWPVGSMWRKNPVPMCGCDIGTGCGGKHESEAAAAHAQEMTSLDRVQGKTCKAVPLANCGKDVGVNTCLKCGTKSAYDCEDCCPGLTKINKGAYSYCSAGKPPGPGPPPGPGKTCKRNPDGTITNPRACYSVSYPLSHVAPGQDASRCNGKLM